MAKITEYLEYHVGKRTVITPGDWFRASEGPYYITSTGSKMAMTERGPFKFRKFCSCRGRKYIEATNKNGIFCILHVGKTNRKTPLDSLVGRPYKILGKTKPPTFRKKKKRKKK